MNSKTLAAVFFLVLASSVCSIAQEPLVLDETCSVTVGNQTVIVRPDGSFFVRNISIFQSRDTGIAPQLYRVRATCLRDGQQVTGQSGFFQMQPGQTVFVEDVFPTELDPIPARITLSSPAQFIANGETAPIQVIATLPDGTTQDMTARSEGTTYLSTNPRLLSVDQNGVVTGTNTVGRPQTGTIAVINEGNLATINFTSVGPSNDFDSDGLPNDYEDLFGLNKFTNDANLDSDNDGLTNIQEFNLGTIPNNPDTDGDGIPDGLDGNPLHPEESPPTVAILTPEDGDTLIQGQRVNFFVDADDDGALTSVSFQTSTGFSTTRTQPPFLVPFTVPTGVSQIVFTATATDTVGNSTSATSTVTVTPDLLTTLQGIVQLEDGNPAENAVVNVLDEGFSTMTDENGSFSITGVPIVRAPLSIRATLGALAAIVPNIEPVPGGITDLGLVVLGSRTPGFFPFGERVFLSDDAQTSIGPMPFPFEFFGAAVTGNMVLNANGVIALNNTSVQSSFNNYTLPRGNNSIVAPFFDDINPGVGGLIGVYDDADVRAITWELVPYFGRSGSNVSFQVAFRRDGSIEFRYADMATPPGGTADSGISVGTATLGLSHFNQVAVPSLGNIANRLTTAITNAAGILNADGLTVLDEFPGNDILVFTPNGAGYTINHNPIVQASGGTGVAIASLDADLDGLTVEQESALLTSTVSSDSDGDGLLDGEEALAGTDPSSTASCFLVRNFQFDAVKSEIHLEWSSCPGKHYAVEGSSDGRSWTRIHSASAIPSQGDYTSVVIGDASADKRFYRVSVRESLTKSEE